MREFADPSVYGCRFYFCPAGKCQSVLVYLFGKLPAPALRRPPIAHGHTTIRRTTRAYCAASSRQASTPPYRFSQGTQSAANFLPPPGARGRGLADPPSVRNRSICSERGGAQLCGKRLRGQAGRKSDLTRIWITLKGWEAERFRSDSGAIQERFGTI